MLNPLMNYIWIPLQSSQFLVVQEESKTTIYVIAEDDDIIATTSNIVKDAQDNATNLPSATKKEDTITNHGAITDDDLCLN